MANITDAELVARTCCGDKEAFGCLVERYQRMAYSVAVRIIRNEDTAQELVQEAMLQAYLSIAQLRDGERFKSWLYKIVSNVCRNHIRMQKAISFSLDELQEGGYQLESSFFQRGTLDPQDIVEARELRNQLLEAFNALSEKNKTVALQFYYERLSLKEIALRLDASVAAVKNRLYRSRKQLVASLSSVYPETTQKILYELRRRTMVKARVADVIQKGDLSFVVLLDEAGQRLLSVQVGLAKGMAIRQGIGEVGDGEWEFIADIGAHARPPTSDFMADLLEKTGVELQEVYIEILKENILCGVAKVWAGGSVREIEARPSDVLALAVRTKSPIYIHEEVLNRAGEHIPEEFRKMPERIFPGRKMLDQAVFSRSHYQAMERMHEPLCDLLASTFSEIMGEEVKVAIAYVDQDPYSKCILDMSKPAYACKFDLLPGNNKALLDISSPVADRLMRSPGGEGHPSTDDSSKMDSIFELILKDLESTLKPFELSIGEMQAETHPDSIELANPDANVFIVAYEIDWSDSVELIWLCYPNETILESILPRLG